MSDEYLFSFDDDAADDSPQDWCREESTDEDKRRFRRYRETILQMLEDGPKETWEFVETTTHRFSCAIQTLREQGHKITKQRVRGGGYLYTLIGFEPTARISTKAKNAYYATSHWKNKRKERLQFDHFQCIQCHSTELLQVHHWSYDLFNESIYDLSTLCEDCHKQIHSNSAIKIKFPKSWKVDVVAQLNRLAEELNGKTDATTETP